MRENLKGKKGNLTKALCFIALVLIAASLLVTAGAKMPGEELCPNHTEHDDTCGYVAATEEIPCDMNCEAGEDGVTVHAEGCAYTPAVEGSPCTHSCGLCDPAGQISPESLVFDKNSKSEGYADAEFLVELNSDTLTGVTLYADGLESELAADEDYTTKEEEGILTVTVYKEALAELETGTVSLSLGFEGEAREIELEITDSGAETEDAEALKEEESEDTQSEDLGESAQEALTASIQPLANDIYAIELSANLSDSQETMDLVRETTGTLNISVSLPQGETGRYIDIYLPDYGMAFSSTLPSVDGNITGVEKLERTVDVGGVSNTVEYLRLSFSDTLDTTLNISIGYVTATISDELDLLWAETGILPATGFQAFLYNAREMSWPAAATGAGCQRIRIRTMRLRSARRILRICRTTRNFPIIMPTAVSIGIM